MTTPRRVRPPAVSGLFYPESAAGLRHEVDTLLAGARAAPAPALDRPERPATPEWAPKAIIAPHAGYVYSGPVAASAFATLSPAAGLRLVVLLGPSHRVPLHGLALPGDDAFATPLGEMAVDAEAVAAVRGLPQVSVFAAAHAQEHSLEVEVPFLQRLFPGAALLPLVVGEASAEEVCEVMERVWGGPETAFVVSSDLSHYLPADDAERVDRETAGEILRLGGPLRPWQACGARPVSGLLLAARRFGLAPTLLDLRNSSDTAGDRSRVVGYGAFAFYAPAHGTA